MSSAKHGNNKKMAARRHFFVIFMFDRANARQPRKISDFSGWHCGLKSNTTPRQLNATSDFSGWHCGLKSNTHIRRHAATAN